MPRPRNSSSSSSISRRATRNLSEKNKPLAEKYKIEGFPTVILLDSRWQGVHPLLRLAVSEDRLFLKHLDQALENKDLD
jgi:hypothetical protein